MDDRFRYDLVLAVVSMVALVLAALSSLPSTASSIEYKIIEDGTQVATKTVDIGGDVGVYAYLAAASDTTCVDAGEFYFIKGEFVNDPINGFALGPDGITLTNGPGFYIIHSTATVLSDRNNTEATIAVFKNGVQQRGCTCTFIKTGGEKFNIAGHVVLELAHGDTLSLRVSSSIAGSVITFDRYSVSLHRFFDDNWRY